MFRFQDPIYLWVLLIIPVLMLIRFISGRQRRRKIRRFGDPDLVKALMPDVSRRRPWVKFALLLMVLALLILMLARPQMGAGVSTDKRAGIETIICMDVSNSMLCQDVEPSRLDKSKMLVENMVDRFNNDKIGLIVFAGEAYVQLPITADYVSAKMFLSEIEPGMIQTQGTDIGRAIDLATHSFSQDDNVGRAIIVITDAEDHEGGAEEAAKAARKQGINVFILGVGSTKGAPIPMGDGSYLKDRNGNTVMTALNEGEAQKIAAAGSGTYIHVDNTSDAEEKLNHELTKLQRGETSSTVYSAYDEQFQALGIIAVVLLVIETLISEAKNSRLSGLQLFRGFRGIHAPRRGPRQGRKHSGGKGAAILLLLLLLPFALSASAQQDRENIRVGNRAYRSQKWAEAETAYRKALAANGQNPQALYNLGCALMQQGKMKQALNFYKRAAQAEPNKIRRARSYHNMGCMYQAKQDYGHALEMYKQALLCNPHDNETRYNYVLCKRLMKNSPQNQNHKNNKNNKNNKNKNNQNKNNQNKNQNKNNQNKQNKNDQDKQNQRHQPQMSKQNAEQLLNAAIQQEQATKQKLQQRMTQPKRRTLQDNW
ncbi:MAG: VWA domain-containing protein [Prevotella sp.]|nr:VWA domain-containing protein [Prevotella sp.]